MKETVVKRREIRSTSTEAERRSHGEAEAEDANDLLRKFFESRFQPLDGPTNNATSTSVDARKYEEDHVEDQASLDSGEDFGGFLDSESEDEHEVMVVEYKDAPKDEVSLDKQTRKSLLSSKISAPKETSTNKKESKQNGGEVDNEMENLQNDLALQRLLKESHLLESGTSDLNPTGKNRHKALDLRLQALGAKKSIFEQKKMPKSHREGIQNKIIKTEANRRREARENGIILEKPVFKQQKSSGKRRERGIGAPAVGKFSGGTLKLSRHDLASIQGPSRRGSKGGKGSKRGRR